MYIYIYTVPTGADPRPWIHATTASHTRPKQTRLTHPHLGTPRESRYSVRAWPPGGGEDRTEYLDSRAAIIQLFFCLTWSQLLAAMDASQHRKPWSATTVCGHLNMPIEMSSWLAAHYLHLATSKVQPSSER